jgi:hypothetical protein
MLSEEQDIKSMSVEELMAAATPMTSRSKICDQLAMQLFVNHQNCKRGNTPLSLSFAKDCEHSEQPYVRWPELNETPTPLDYGWIKNPGYLVIDLQPASKENKAAEENQTVLIWIAGAFAFEVRRGGFFIAGLLPSSDIKLSCNMGSVVPRTVIFSK